MSGVCGAETESEVGNCRRAVLRALCSSLHCGSSVQACAPSVRCPVLALASANVFVSGFVFASGVDLLLLGKLNQKELTKIESRKKVRILFFAHSKVIHCDFSTSCSSINTINQRYKGRLVQRSREDCKARPHLLVREAPRAAPAHDGHTACRFQSERKPHIAAAF